MPLRHSAHFLLLSILVPLVAQSMTILQTFTDVKPGVWFYNSVEEAVSRGIVSGYRDAQGRLTGRFGPENEVTIGEALKISIKGAGFDENLGQGYGHWAAKYLSIALGENFEFSRQSNINFDWPASRAEVASMIADAFRVPRISATGRVFTDVAASSPYASAIESLKYDGIITGDTDAAGRATGRFRPNAAINRAEVVKMVIAARAFYGTPGGTGTSSTSWSSTSSRSSTSRSSSSSSGGGQCTLSQCGMAPGMPNWQCPDNSIGGPSCEKLPDGRCGWLIRQCPTTSSSSSKSSSSRSSSSSSSSLASVTFTVTYTNTGFQPSVIYIRQNDRINFRNQSGLGLEVASNPHPSHGDYPEFDAHMATASGGTYSFVFGRVGTWGYHNHLRENHQAVVVVDPR